MNKRITFFCVISSLCVMAFLFSACEKGGADDGDVFKIAPSSVTLSATDNTVALQAVGGNPPFVWEVTDDTLGAVGSSGQTVTYTRKIENGVNTVKITDSKTWTAKATITQQEEPAELTISEAIATLNNDGDKAVFTGSGGTGPYSWSVGDASRGSIASIAWSQAIYTRNSLGDNTVIMTDYIGHSAIAQITQPAPTTLTASAGSSTLSNNGDKTVITASDGVPPYTWAVQHATLGSPDTFVGTSVVYERNSAGDNVVTVHDSKSNVVKLIIEQP